jgi:zinc protease
MNRVLPAAAVVLALQAAVAFAQPATRKGKRAPPPAANKGGPAAATGAKPGTAAPPIEEKKIFPFPIDAVRLKNGFTLLLVPYDSPGLVAYYTLVRTGSRNEVEAGRSGFAHFFEHMMFRGTERHPKDDYDQSLSRAGVSNNAFTTDDFTCYTVFGPSAALPLVAELEADRFQNLKYSREDFQTEARAVLGEYNKNFSNPAEKMEEVLRDTAFTAHTYKHTTIGFEADVKAMPSMYDYSLEFFKRWYTPDNATLLVVGDFDAATVKEIVLRLYGDWQGTASAIKIPKEPRQAQRRAVHVPWENETQPRLLLGWHTPEARLDTRDAALQNVLGPYLFGPTSPTYKDLVLDRQLAAALDVQYFDHRDPFLFYVLATLKSDEAFVPTQEAIARAVSDLLDGKVDEKRLGDIKSNQKYGLLKSFDNASTVALQLVFAMGPTGSPDALNSLFNQMDALTKDDLVAFARAQLVDTNLTSVSLVGKGGKAPEGATIYVPRPPDASPKEPAAPRAAKKGRKKRGAK